MWTTYTNETTTGLYIYLYTDLMICLFRPKMSNPGKLPLSARIAKYMATISKIYIYISGKFTLFSYIPMYDVYMDVAIHI